MIKLFLIVYFIMLPVMAFSAGIDDIYVQQGKEIMGFSQAVSYQHGSVIKKNNSEYLVNIYNKKFIVNFKSEQSVQGLAAVFPEHIFVNLAFLNVKPNKEIYFDNNHLDSTDNQGNANKYFYLDKAGSYSVQLRDMKNKLVESDTIDINSRVLVKCTGNKKMLCKAQIGNFN